MGLIAGFGALFCVIGVVATLPDNNLGPKIAGGVAAVALACLAVRCWRLAVIAGPDQLVVRNFFRTVRISWQDIAGFEPSPPYGTLWKAGLGIRLTDGRLIAATAFGRNQYETGRVQAAVIRELEELRRQRAGDRAPDG